MTVGCIGHDDRREEWKFSANTSRGHDQNMGYPRLSTGTTRLLTTQSRGFSRLRTPGGVTMRTRLIIGISPRKHAKSLRCVRNCRLMNAGRQWASFLIQWTVSVEVDLSKTKWMAVHSENDITHRTRISGKETRYIPNFWPVSWAIIQ